MLFLEFHTIKTVPQPVAVRIDQIIAVVVTDYWVADDQRHRPKTTVLKLASGDQIPVSETPDKVQLALEINGGARFA